MIRLFLLVCVTMCVTMLAACSVVSEQSIYEGMRTRQRTESAGSGQTSQELPSYGKYQKERDDAR